MQAQERLRAIVRSLKAMKVGTGGLFKGVKEVLTLVQLQVGVVPTFSISYPSNFLALLSFLSELALPALPLGCFTDIDYYRTLLWSTLAPPVVISVLRLGRQFDAIFFFIFLIYPVCGVYGTRCALCKRTTPSRFAATTPPFPTSHGRASRRQSSPSSTVLSSTTKRVCSHATTRSTATGHATSCGASTRA